MNLASSGVIALAPNNVSATGLRETEREIVASWTSQMELRVSCIYGHTTLASTLSYEVLCSLSRAPMPQVRCTCRLALWRAEEVAPLTPPPAWAAPEAPTIDIYSVLVLTRADLLRYLRRTVLYLAMFPLELPMTTSYFVQ